MALPSISLPPVTQQELVLLN
jgi:hypothetical protein